MLTAAQSKIFAIYWVVTAPNGLLAAISFGAKGISMKWPKFVRIVVVPRIGYLSRPFVSFTSTNEAASNSTPMA